MHMEYSGFCQQPKHTHGVQKVYSRVQKILMHSTQKLYSRIQKILVHSAQKLYSRVQKILVHSTQKLVLQSTENLNAQHTKTGTPEYRKS